MEFSEAWAVIPGGLREVSAWREFLRRLFERHGNFTPAQLAAIPALLDCHNIILCAPTAGGKTEAAVAPLIERHCPPLRSRPRPTWPRSPTARSRR